MEPVSRPFAAARSNQWCRAGRGRGPAGQPPFGLPIPRLPNVNHEFRAWRGAASGFSREVATMKRSIPAAVALTLIATDAQAVCRTTLPPASEDPPLAQEGVDLTLDLPSSLFAPPREIHRARKKMAARLRLRRPRISRWRMRGRVCGPVNRHHAPRRVTASIHKIRPSTIADRQWRF